MNTQVTNDEMRTDHWFAQVVLDIFSAQIAVLDKKGTIIAVNKA